jgi:hypothetical protein
MFVKYADGRVMEAVILSYRGETLRLVGRGAEDVLECTRVNGKWVSEECEVVDLDFGNGRPVTNASCSDQEFLCSPSLAARLLHILVIGEERDNHALMTARQLAAWEQPVCAGRPM